MRALLMIAILVRLLSFSNQGEAASGTKVLILEIDPFKPITAAYDENAQKGVSAANWSGRVDFNVQGAFSTGPEFWVGNFVKRGRDYGDGQPRREELWLGEQQKLSASRFRWNFTVWEIGEAMRGWSLTAGYDYIRIDAKANRYTDGPADTLPVGAPIDAPQDETDMVTDIRHGFHIGLGQRWLIASRLTISLQLTLNTMSKRIVSVTSKDPKAEASYEALIETIPNFHSSARPYPEAGFGLGYAF